MNVKQSSKTIEAKPSHKSPSYKSLDPSVMKPQRRHLETVESERILIILDDTIKNICLIATFDSIMDDIEEFAFLLGQQLYRLFCNFKPIYDEYANLTIIIEQARGEFEPTCLDQEADEPNETHDLPEDFWTVPIQTLKKPEDSSNMSRSSKISETDISEYTDKLPELLERKKKLRPLIQFYIKSIIIAFRKNPHAIDCLMSHKDSWRIKRNVSLTQLIELLHQLRQILFARLLTNPQEMDEKTRYLAAVCRKEKEHQVVIGELNATLAQMKTDKEKTISQMNFNIIDLQKEIRKMEIDGQNELHKLEKKTQREIQEIQATHDDKKSKLESDLNNLKIRYKEMVDKNKNDELEIRRRKWKLETETENWINKYDSEMADYQMQYDKLKSEYDGEKNSLAELQKIFEPLEKEYLQVLEEQRIAKERQEAKRAENEALVYWATVIQSFWRAWKARKLMRKNRRR